MTKQLTHTSRVDSVILTAYLVCLLAFLLPASRILLFGQQVTQYLLTGYPGWVAFAVVLISAIVQSVFFYRKKKILKWTGLVTGIYATWFAIKMIYESYALNNAAGPSNLAGKMQFASAPQIGLFLFSFAGGVLFVLSLIGIIAKTRSSLP